MDNYKVRLEIDEYHLSRINQGLKGTTDYNGQTHRLKITKVYPVVENGQFKVDMEFIGQIPGDLTRGQTLPIQLMLGESESTLVLDRGGFYQKTGGNWIYKISEDGAKAVKHDIRLGRQNPNYFEVLAGLDKGDQVIISDYGSFGENEVLNIE